MSTVTIGSAEGAEGGAERVPHRGARGVIHSFATYIETARAQRPHPSTRDAVLRCLTDLLAAAAAGCREPGVRAVRRVARDTMRDGDVPIWFSGQRSSALGAAWANSAAAAALDLDDGHRIARGHPGAAVIPVALAVARTTGASPDRLVNAIAIGYEVGVSIAAARTSYGNTGTWSACAVVATAAALREVAADRIAHALAIAEESAPNQLFLSAPAQAVRPEGSDVKEGIAWSVVTGMTALDLAEAGYTGPRNRLDSPLHYGFPDDFVAGAAGHVHHVYFKLHACCRHVHAPLDALIALMTRHRIDPASIESIEVWTYGGALRITNKVRPEHLADVQYSIPYCLALVALRGERALLPLTARALGDDAATALAMRVHVRLDPSLDARFPAQTLARVAVTSHGVRYESDVTAPRGEADMPLTDRELEAKFADATREVASEAQREQMLGALRDARGGDFTALDCSLTHLDLVDRRS
ncbi:MmgE/PrpD family protein [Burkholderia sp. 22PA0106]|uniref:MmgE/PrpD family protein n=1 Tax=Burkholderia sp. 22PA0106 TaxID=3237371 RepID=UPI0039C49011